MECVLANLPLPPTFTDLIGVSEAIWSTLVDDLRNLKPDALHQYAESSLQYLKSLVNSKEPLKFQRLTLGLRCISRIISDTSQYEDLITVLLYTCPDSVSMQFAAHTTAEIAASLPPNEDGFPKRQLEYAQTLIKIPNTNVQLVLMGLFLLRELAFFIPLPFLMHSTDIPDQIWPWLLNKSSNEVREAAAQVLERYLNVLVKYQGYKLREIFDSILQKAVNELSQAQTDCPQGLLIVILLLLKAKGHFFKNSTKDIYNCVKPFLTAKNLEAKSQSIAVIAQLSSIDPEYFSEFLYNITMEAIVDSGDVLFCTALDALSVIIKNVPKKITDSAAIQISIICLNATRKNYDSFVPNMFNVLISLTKYVPHALSIPEFRIWDLVNHFLFTDSFVTFFPILNQVVNEFWGQYSTEFAEKIKDVLDIKPEHLGHLLKTNALKLIPLLPPLPLSHSSQILYQLKKYVFHKSDILRALTAAALLHLMQESSQAEVYQTLHQLLEIASSDDSEEVRVQYLESFSTDHFLPFLAHSIFLHFFRKLSHDISPKVRSACFRLLKRLQPYSPLGANIILRHSLVDTFYSLQMSNNLMQQVKNARVLPDLVSASPSLFGVYATTFVPIVLQMLAKRFAPGTTVSMNPLDPELRSQLALSLVLTLHEIVLSQQLLRILFFLEGGKFLPDFAKICTAILGEWGDKPLKHAVLMTVFDFVSMSGSTQEVLKTAPDLLPTLFALIENCNSRSLRVRALKFIGLCGAASPKRLRLEMNLNHHHNSSNHISNSNNSSKNNNSNNINYNKNNDNSNDNNDSNNSNEFNNYNYGDENSLPDLFLVGNKIMYNDFFLEVVFAQLKSILVDKSLRSIKVRSLLAATESLKIKSTLKLGKYFEELIPIILNEVEGDNANDGLSVLEKFIYVSGQRVVKYVQQIMETIHHVWNMNLFPGILSVVAALVTQVGPDFLPFASQLITNLLDVLSSTVLTKPSDAMRIIPILASICPSFPHLSQLMVPHICTIATSESASREIKVCALNALRFLVQTTKKDGNTSLLLRVSLTCCVSNDKELSSSAFQVLYSLMIRLGRGFNLYTHRVVEKLAQHKTMPNDFLHLSEMMMTENELKLDDFPFIVTEPLLNDKTNQVEMRKMFDPRPLIEQFNTTNNMTTPKHWQSWFVGFVLSFIRESPNISISSCKEVAAIHRPLATALFFPSFLSCWIHMGDETKSQISQRINLILSRPGLPPEVLQCFARLAEYMDRAEKPLIIPSELLTPIFTSAQCFALALHNEQERLQAAIGKKKINTKSSFDSEILNNSKNYEEQQNEIKEQKETKEQEDQEDQQKQVENESLAPEIMKSVIQLYVSLGKSGAAKALLQKNDSPEEWLLKLGQWDEALSYFQKKLAEFPSDDAAFIGYVCSCGKLRKFDLIRKISASEYSLHGKRAQTDTAIDFAHAHFFGGDFNAMLKYANNSAGDSVDGHIARAQAHLMLSQNQSALHVIESAFALVAAQSSALFCRRYETIYPTLLRCQVLYELQEIAEKGANEVPRGQWANRIRTVEYTSEVWWPFVMSRIILTQTQSQSHISTQTQTYVQTQTQTQSYIPAQTYIPTQMYANAHESGLKMGMRLRDEDTTTNMFLELLLNERRYEVFEAIFKLFYPNFAPQTSDEFVILQYLKYVWATGDRPKALNNLGVLLKRTQPTSRTFPSIFKSYVDWALTLTGRNMSTLKGVIKTLKPIMCLPKQSYAVWQRWATVNYHMFSLTSRSEDYDDEDISTDADTNTDSNTDSHMSLNTNMNSSTNIKTKKMKMKYAVEAIKGYIYCISQVQGSGNGSNNFGFFSEVVQLLSLFFATSNDKTVLQATTASMSNLSSKIFVDTIPQLIAQLSHQSQDTVELVKKILSEISVTDYQILLFPLLVAKMSPNSRKRDVANHLLNEISTQHANAVNQAMQMQSSLLLAATTVFERVSKLIINYLEITVYQKKYSEGYSLLLKIKQMVINPSSAFDRLLHQVVYLSLQKLTDALKGIDSFSEDTNSSVFEEVDTCLRQMLSEIDHFMDKLTTLSVNDVCPELLKLTDTEIAVPGAYLASQKSIANDSENKTVMISSFLKSFDVLGSKKRPRKAAIVGNDGLTYKYLLKGSEDLRLDQRVMQFFRLINTQIRNDYSLSIDDVTIRVYTIVSLSSDVGLIQWVEGGDTFHHLLAEYRDAHNIRLDFERQKVAEFTHAKIDDLRPIQRFEALLETISESSSSDDDLKVIFWLKSLSSDAWLEKVTKFARSTALMSVVGYVLGLGDRHPSNFMIDRNTGDAIHIDFGDCFEVARNRVQFPEEIPFRLTRMMIKSFGVCGIEGDFRPVCERVMMLVRENTNSLVSVLEIFVQEPIQDGEIALPPTDIMPRIWRKMQGSEFFVGKHKIRNAENNNQNESGNNQNESGNNQNESGNNQNEYGNNQNESGNNQNEGGNNQNECENNEVRNKNVEINREEDIETKPMPVSGQVAMLIRAAVDNYNLSKLYSGWCPLW